MYEYAPNPSRLREKIIVAIAGILAAVLYVVSTLPKTAFAWTYQLGAVLCLTLAVLITTRFLLRYFVYRIEPSDGGNGTDFVILEGYGKKITTVCRISQEDIRKIEPWTKETKAAWKAEMKGKRVYRYTAELSPRDAVAIRTEEAGETCFLIISADLRLSELLSVYNSNNCPLLNEK